MNSPASGAARKRILLVEDDEGLASTIEQMLTLKGLDVVVESEGLGAKSRLTGEQFDLVLSDIRLPGLTGIQLLHQVKKLGTPVVLMTGFSEIGDSQEAYDLGAKGFLSKPFRKQELFQVIDQLLFPEGAPAIELDDQFSALNIEEFTTGNEIQFDIFVRFSATKYVRVAAAGEAISRDRITSYQGKGLTHLYLRKEDFRRYLGFTSLLAKRVASAATIDRERKAAFLAQQAKVAIKSLYREKVDPQMFSLATDLTVTAVDTLCQQPQAATLLETLKSLGDPAYAHSLAVSLYSNLVAKQIGWRSPRTLVRLSMAGLLHDIGKKELDPELLAKPRVALTNEDVKLLESHTLRGEEILRGLPDVPEEVTQVALQHHEDCKGLGYPMRLTKNHIVPLARLVGTVDDLCELCFPLSASQAALDPSAALQRICETNQGRRDQEYLSALVAVFQGNRPPSH